VEFNVRAAIVEFEIYTRLERKINETPGCYQAFLLQEEDGISGLL
jgi:hypothetical protein